jgi:hypothetical protein
MGDGYDEQEPEDGYGPSPATRARRELYVRPALAAVAVEIVVTVFFGNQWMLDHVVVPWNTSNNIAKGSVSDALGAVSWPLTPHGYPWLWLGSIVRALVWFGLTYLFVRRLVDVRDMLGRFVGIVGAVFLAQLGALVADRLVGYPNVAEYYRALGPLTAKPSFAEWLLTGAVGTGGVLLFAVVAAVIAIAVNAAVSLSETEETADETD